MSVSAGKIRQVVVLATCTLLAATYILSTTQPAWAKSELSKSDTVLDFSESVRVIGEQGYQLIGADPYFILAVKSASVKNETKALTLRLSLESAIAANKIAYQVFFRESATSGSFDPLYHFSFQAPDVLTNGETQTISVPLPNSLDLSNTSRIRLDIDGCTSCVLRLDQASLETLSTNTQSKPIQVSGLLQGADSITGAGIDLHKLEWRLNDLDGTTNHFQIKGADPFLVSPEFSFNTENLGGVMVQVRAPAQLTSIALQLFYATEGHGFSESATSLLRVPATDLASGIVVPLNFLSEEAPRQSLLKRLRLDIDTTSDQEWYLAQVKLLSKRQLNESKHLIPQRLLQSKQQRSRGLALLLKSFKKVWSDSSFSIAYLLLLVLTCLGFLRAFRK